MLKDFARMSQIAGSRPDYVQGGGGNTSVKFPDGTMAIKASGFRLRQVTESDGFAVVERDTLRDVTAERGYKPLRPSVEAGFHALLGRFVLHTHPVYANLALCSEGGAARLPEVMEGIGFISVPYRNPGEELSAAIRERLTPDTRVVLMANHGIVVTEDTADACLRLHDEVNDRFAKAYGVTLQDFQAFARQLDKTLYPDQQVYVTLTDAQREIMAAVMFLQFTLMRNGETPRSMDAAARDFIRNWESEAYRKTVIS
jgi:rhamnose utilization protein RhaD (predicted bifunctional aldolase and dehydrogenase)